MDHYCIELFFGGKFQRDPTELYDGYKWFTKHILYYKGGRVQYFYNIDPDKMSYFELKGMIEQECLVKDMVKMFYTDPNKPVDIGLKIVNDDKYIIEMMKMAKNERVVVYVEHEQGDDIEKSEDDKEVDVGDCLEEKEIKYKKKKSGTEEVDQVPDEPHEEASEAAIEQVSDVANELPNEMDTGGAGEDTGGAGDDESDYAASDDYLSPKSSEEEDKDVASVKERKRNLKVKKRMYPIFNPNVEMSNIQIELGMRFGNAKQLKECLKKYAVHNGYPIHFNRNVARRFEAVCVGDGCSWNLYASYMQSENSMQIKTLESEHKCKRHFSIRLANSQWLADYYNDRIIDNPKWKVRKRGKEVVVEKLGTKSGTTKKGKEKCKETVKSGTKSGTTEVSNEANQEANQVRRENKAPSSNVGEGMPTVSKRGKRAANDVPQGASKRKTGVKGRKDHVPEGVGVFTADNGNSYLKMSATRAPILINEAKISEANNKRKGRPPLPRRSSKAPVISLQSNQVSSEAQVPSSQGSISASKQVSTTASKQSLTTAFAQASATASKQSLTTDAVASSSKPKTRSAAALETHHQVVASRNSQSLTTDAVASSSKPRNSPSKTKQKIAALTVRTRANSKPKTRSAAAKAKTKVWK
ncbi:hypothetical protein IFM89_010307 [Coptis chinensis]|uniref:Transposase MuDR plant domain-containing protein n=1 Tax=Coptis chinensis TaxID=261450 RepID=A0A835H4D4_9MAGN|nr:hypothetical protein IFM89_010307 [Coptis chinensis]